MTAPIWAPSPERVAATNITAFIADVNRRWDESISNYAQLHVFSVDHPEKFWLSVWQFCGILSETRGERVIVNPDKMLGAKFFPDARLNIARTLLRRRDDRPALIGLREDGRRSEMSFAELYAMVSRLTQAMRAAGLGVGDRIVSFIPSVPEAAAAMIASLSIGAVWASCSPEYGVAAALDRIAQIGPKMLLTADGYLYGGRSHDLLAKVKEIVAQQPSITVNVVLGVVNERPDLSDIPGAVPFDDFVTPYAAGEIEFESLPFNQPGFILFSSGTTGAPKCIIHSAGAALLENLKAHVLQFDVKPDDRVYMTCTTGWVVWKIMLIALGAGASAVLYDGSSFYPTKDVLLHQTAAERVTFVRLAARYVETLAKAGFEPIQDHDLSALRTVMCNGSPFGIDGYEYIYAKVKADIHLVSPSGGTDSFGSLVSNDPSGPVWSGEIQRPALGFRIEIFDADGKPTDETGELVVTQAFPTMPLGYLNDPSGDRYRDAYFRHFPNVWRHGDWASVTEHGGIIISGRSDSTLNAKGVRIGSAEIYRQLATVPEVAESAVVAQDWEGDTRMVLFVQLQPGFTLSSDLAARIRADIRDNLSPRHVPAKIIQVAEIPLTVTGKVSEAAVREAMHGRQTANRGVLANPGALDHFSPEKLPELLG